MKRKLKLVGETVLRMLPTVVMLLLLIYFVKHPQVLAPCQAMHVNGTVEDTGLYGNCNYLNNLVKKEERIPVRWNVTV